MRFRVFAASALAVAALAGCGSDEEPSSDARATVPTVEPLPAETVPDTAPAILKVYLLDDGKVTVATRSVVAGPAVARAALNELLKGPTKEEAARGLRSAIPPGTTITSLELVDCAAEADLSREIDEAATAQVVFTLTQFEAVCVASVNEDEPIKRGQLEDFVPAVLVESPVPGEDVTSPIRIEGTANTFEATFNVEVVDARGRVLGERFVTATSGSGTRGTFDAAVTFAALPGPVTLVVYETSAEDGSRMNERRIPLNVAP